MYNASARTAEPKHQRILLSLSGACIAALCALALLAGCSTQASQRLGSTSTEPASTPAESAPPTAQSLAESGSATTPNVASSDASPAQSASAPEATPSTSPSASTMPSASDRSATSNPQTARMQSIIDEMTLEEKIAQLFVITPEALVGTGPVTMAGEATAAALQHYPVGGLIYFSENIYTPEQTSDMLAATQSFAQQAGMLPLFLCVDEEGGTVSRIGSNYTFDLENPGDMRAVGDAGDTQAAYDIAYEIGTQLDGIGFNVDFAPVADVASGESTTMSQRSFGQDATLVASMVSEQVRGFADAGILSCAKHFPGIGAAFGDSHTDVIAIFKNSEEMHDEELVPFKAAISQNVPFIMIGHVETPAITYEYVPASLSQQIVTGLLRDELGYKGIVITDSLSMGAVTATGDAATVAVEALQAGVDMLLTPADFESAYQGVLSAVARGTLTEERIDESLERIVSAKLSL